MNGDLTPADLEARLNAQRQILQWLLQRVVADADAYGDLVAHINASLAPNDHQEDPGAVPTEGYVALAGAGIEIRALLEPLARKWGPPGGVD